MQWGWLGARTRGREMGGKQCLPGRFQTPTQLAPFYSAMDGGLLPSLPPHLFVLGVRLPPAQAPCL